jgi:hypothetical protein
MCIFVDGSDMPPTFISDSIICSIEEYYIELAVRNALLQRPLMPPWFMHHCRHHESNTLRTSYHASFPLISFFSFLYEYTRSEVFVTTII